MAIYLKINKPDTIQEVLLKLFSRGTYWHKGAQTFHDEACTQTQCEPDKWRSFDDVFEIVNTYFPKKNVKDIIQQLLVLPLKNNSNNNLYFYPTFCNTINMCTAMFYPEIVKDIRIFTEVKGIGKYAWGELLELLGITNDEELKNYIEQNKTKIKNEETITETV